MKLVKKSGETEAECIVTARRIASIAYDYKAKNLKAFDVRELTVLTDSFLICSVTSEPQLKAVYNNVKDGMKEIGVAPLHAEGAVSSNWLVLDFETVMFHIFREKAFEFYDLEGLWGDAPEIDLGLDDE